MTFIPAAQLGASRFVSFDPEGGVLAAEAPDGTVQNLLAADPATGGVVHRSYGPGGPHVFQDGAGNPTATLSAAWIAAQGEVMAQGTLNVREWANLLHRPDVYPPSAHTHGFAEITGKPTTLAGYGITDALAAGHTHALADAAITGILPPSKGGTGRGDLGAQGTLLVSTGNGLAYAQVTDASVAPGAAVAWSKISKTGAVAADVGALSQDAGDARYFPLTGGVLNGSVVAISAGQGDIIRLLTQVPWYGSNIRFEDGDAGTTWRVGINLVFGNTGVFHVGHVDTGHVALVASPNGWVAINPLSHTPAEALDVNGNVLVRGHVRFADGSLQAAAAYATTASDARYVRMDDLMSGLLMIPPEALGFQTANAVVTVGVGGLTETVGNGGAGTVLLGGGPGLGSATGMAFGKVTDAHVASGAAISASKIDFAEPVQSLFVGDLGASLLQVDGQLLAPPIGINFSPMVQGNAPLFNIPDGALLCHNLDAEKLGGRYGHEYLYLGNATGTLPWSQVAHPTTRDGYGITDVPTRGDLASVGTGTQVAVGNLVPPGFANGGVLIARSGPGGIIEDGSGTGGGGGGGLGDGGVYFDTADPVPGSQWLFSEPGKVLVGGAGGPAFGQLSDTHVSPYAAIAWSKVAHPTTRDGYGLEDVPTLAELGMGGSVNIAPGNIDYPGLLGTWGVLAGFSPQGAVWVNGGAAGTVFVGGGAGPAFSQIGNAHVAANAALSWSKIDHPATRDGYGLTDVPTRAELAVEGPTKVAPGNVQPPSFSNGAVLIARSGSTLLSEAPAGAGQLQVDGGSMSPASTGSVSLDVVPAGAGTQWLPSTAETVLVGGIEAPVFAQIDDTHISPDAAIAWSKIDRTSALLSDLGGTLAVTAGGTGVTTATLGDLVYGSGVNTRAVLTGNQTTTRKFLGQTGTGTLSAAPVWVQPAFTDLTGRLAYVQLPNAAGTWNAGGGTVQLTGALQLSGALALGGSAVSTSTLLSAAGNTASATTQFGVAGDPAGSSAATGAVTGGWFRARTQAAAFTTAALYGVEVAAPVLGPRSSATVAVGLRIANQTGAATNYSMQVGTAPSAFAGGVLVGALAQPDAAAAVEIRTTSQGFLPPRMTTTQRDAISTPPDGLIVYNSTTGKLNLREGGAWKALTSA
jgi:hypothetical protein